MILKAVHEAHGTRPANVLVSGSGPRVLWTLGGGSKTFLMRNYPHQTPTALPVWCCKVSKTELDEICSRGRSLWEQSVFPSERQIGRRKARNQPDVVIGLIE